MKKKLNDTSAQSNPIFLIESVYKTITSKQSKSLNHKIESVSPELIKLSELWNISTESSFLFSIILIQSFKRGDASLSDISHLLGIDFFDMFRMNHAIEELVEAGFISKRSSGFRDSICYKVPSVISSRIMNNKPITRRSIKDLDNTKFFRILNSYVKTFNERDCNLEEYVQNLRTLLEYNQHLPFSSFISEQEINTTDTFFLSILLNSIFSEGNNLIDLHSFSYKYDRNNDDINFEETIEGDGIDFSTLRMDLQSNTSQLQELKIIQPVRNGEFKSVLVYELTPKFQDLFFKDVDLLFFNHVNSSRCDLIEVVYPEDIKSVNLIYDKEVEEQLNSFKSIFLGDNLSKVMIRFKEIGVQSNFVSLLMGPPGVGKSQWITQLGRESGRNIYNVDLGKVKDAYVGESEKNILSIFQYYNQQVERVVNRGGDKDGNRIPILVINECEVLMNNRTMFERKTSVENMLQSIVNLLLLKLEELKGIVIMTTNTDNPHNIDPAFSRRINYKFLIPKPSAQVRGRIIHSVLGEWFSENDCSVLGEKYDLTGGLVKNIHQKVVSHYVLQGSIPSIETLHGWCDNESKGFGLMNSKSSIGFNSQ